MAPKEELIDIVLPLAVRTARVKICCLVPTAWLQHEEGPRANWIVNLRRFCNLSMVPVDGQGHKGGEQMWIFIDSLVPEARIKRTKELQQQAEA